MNCSVRMSVFLLWSCLSLKPCPFLLSLFAPLKPLPTAALSVNVVLCLVEVVGGGRPWVSGPGQALQQQVPEAGGQAQEGLGAGDQVEGHRDGPALLEVGEPQFGPGELPLHVRVVLPPFRGEGRYGSAGKVGLI